MDYELPEGVRRMLADAGQRGLDVDLRPRPPARSLAEAAGLLGIEPADIAKTLVVRLSAGSYLFAVVGGDSQISWPKLRAVLGVNKLTMPGADEARAATGYERGTITPIGSEPAWPLVVDQRLAGRRVALGAGSHGFSVFVEVDDLVRELAARVSDISG
jgi:Cys-tRNA(Pro)/Cys-tRNA(Cys) deacylase